MGRIDPDVRPWAVSTERRRPGDHVTRADVCHLHADRAAAERCGAALGGAPELIRLAPVTSRVWRVEWSLSATAGGTLRAAPAVAAPAPAGPVPVRPRAGLLRRVLPVRGRFQRARGGAS